jgi:hypothetical protein
LVTIEIFVGFKKLLIWPMISVWTKFIGIHTGAFPMHDLLICLAFIGIVVAPAVVMAKTTPAESKID